MQVKVLLCGTHPHQFNGYSKVVYELALELCKYEDIKLYIYGFQNFYNDNDHINERSLPEKVEIYDAYANEEPKNKGFGEKEINEYVKKISPDIVIVYNDIIVISTLIKALDTLPDRKFKIIPYIDIVYKNEKKEMLKFIHDNIDGCIAFTDYWKQMLIDDNNYTKPVWTLEHAFNKNLYYPIPQHIARKYFEINDDDFIIMNLNRNQPRKRWDHCIMAFIKFISKHLNTKIKLMILTAVTGAWNLTEIMMNEARKYKIEMSQLKNHFIFIQNPQKLTDKEINIMYNVADIGLNTCDGEGFGLCNFEQAGVGIPQIVPNIGGFRDFFNEQNSIPITPKFSLYNDVSKDVVGGELEICAIDDYVDALEKYYKKRTLIKEHGIQSRKDITKKYVWTEKAAHLRNIIIESTRDLFPTNDGNALMNQINDITSCEDMNEDMNVDIDKLIDEKLKVTQLVSNKKTHDDEKLNNMSKDDLKVLQDKINRLLNN